MDIQMVSTMDTTIAHSPATSPNFLPLARSPRVVVPISAESSAHLLHDMPSAFPNTGDLPNPLPNRMHVSIPEFSAPVTMNSMDVLHASPSALPPAPGLLHGFQPRLDTFGLPPHLDTKIEMESPSNLSLGSHPQIPPSPMHIIPPSYTVATSSLATALDSMVVPVGRSRAGSSASPGRHPPPISPIGYPSVNGGHPSMDSGRVQFPHASYSNRTGGIDNPPELTIGQLFMSVSDTMESMAKTIDSVRETLSLGQTTEVNAKMDELRRATLWVSETISKIDAPLPCMEPSPSYVNVSAVNTKHSPQAGSGLPDVNPPLIDTHATQLQVNFDGQDVCRKRCASSMAEAGDRVIKAPKMEPQDDATLLAAASPTKPSPPFPAPGTSMPMAGIPNQSLPPSTSPSRPSSPGVLSMNLLQPAALNFSHLLPSSAPPMDFGLPPSFPPQPVPPFPLGARNRASWSDAAVTPPHRHHQHSLSGPSLNVSVNHHGLPIIPPPSSLPFSAPGTFGSPPPSMQGPITNGGSSISQISCSGSMPTLANSLPYGFTDVPTMDTFEFSCPSTSASALQIQTISQDSDEEEETEDDAGDAQLKSGNQSSSEAGSSGTRGNDVPQEYRAEVDRIFFEFLNKICSNLDAADAKGEPIHQTLMAKKMQRLDESPDFRPFKFRIAAFTNAFLEELARKGYPEDKIPMKKIRNYLWKQEYIQRFNEDGKKAKSKGNHIWNIDAKKGRDGRWIFRPFHRKLAGSPPGIAYIGLRWAWTPRIWDPQASSLHIPVQYSSPVLPSWLSWKEDVISGTPPPDAESCNITVVATSIRDGQEEQLVLPFHLNVAPISTLDTSFSPSRRPSLADPHGSRRVQSDPVVPQVASRTSQQPPATSQGAQVMQVLTSAAQRVAQEAQSQVIASLSPTGESSGHELQALVKQQHVLTMTAAAFDKEFTSQHQEGSPPSPSRALAKAAHQVVLQAARSVRADRSAAANIAAAVGGSPPSPSAALPQVTVNEVSVATQTAVAQAVEITGPLSSEVDVLRTATSLLLQQAWAPNTTSSEPSQLTTSMDTTPALPPRPFLPTGSGSAPPFSSSLLPPASPEYESHC